MCGGHLMNTLQWYLCITSKDGKVVVIYLYYQHGFQHKPILATVSKINIIPDKISTACLLKLDTFNLGKKKSHTQNYQEII